MSKDIEIIERQRQSFKEFMQKHKLNAFSWAKKAGIAEATIRHYLSGRNQSLTSVNLERLATSVGARLEELIGQITLPKINQPINISNFNPSNSIEIERDLFIQVFTDLEMFILNNRMNVSVKVRANILLSWYKLTQLLKQNGQEKASPEMFKELFNKIAAEG
jgi:hypothetical protein